MCNGSTKVFGSFSLGSNPKEASKGNVAQLVEHFVEAEGVSSSSLLISTYDFVAQLVEHYTFNVGVLRSSRSGITIRRIA